MSSCIVGYCFGAQLNLSMSFEILSDVCSRKTVLYVQFGSSAYVRVHVRSYQANMAHISVLREECMTSVWFKLALFFNGVKNQEGLETLNLRADGLMSDDRQYFPSERDNPI